MSAGDILLIIVSGLGVVHGLFLAVFLWLYQEGNTRSNKILSLLLVVLSFRVGKSVFMEFAEGLDIKLILIGLAMLMAIGPLFYLFTLSVVNKDFQFKRQHLIHYLPALLGISFGMWINEAVFKTIPVMYILMMFVTYYGHYLGYLLISYFKFSREKGEIISTSAQALWRLLFWGLLAVWVVYVLNLFDEFIPYIVGPVLYTLVAYVISFVVIRKGYIRETDHIKYKTTPVSDDKLDEIFAKVNQLVADEKQFKNADLTLTSLSKKLNVSTQVLSMAINKQGKVNFNGFINRYRIEESISMFEDGQFHNHTIAAIAFEVGFNSITSFNTAFKKQTGQTPLTFRKNISK